MIDPSFHLKIRNRNPRISWSVIYLCLEGTSICHPDLKDTAKPWEWSGEEGEDGAVAAPMGCWAPQGSEGRQVPLPGLTPGWLWGKAITSWCAVLSLQSESSRSYSGGCCKDLVRL